MARGELNVSGALVPITLLPALTTCTWNGLVTVPRLVTVRPLARAPRLVTEAPPFQMTFTVSAASLSRNEIVPAVFVRQVAYGFGLAKVMGDRAAPIANTRVGRTEL